MEQSIGAESRATDLLIDTKELNSKYDLKEIIGSGTSSTVYRAVHKRTGQEFAMKIVDVSGEHGEDLAQQMREETMREIEILKRCHGNENIIQLYEYFKTNSNIIMVIEICKYGELFDYLTKMISLSEKKVRSLMQQIFEAVEFIHKRKIVHRDLKPENILLVDETKIKISDFGFGVIMKDRETLTQLCGTPAYLAPEVLTKSMYEDAPGYGTQVDMWACGVIMFTLMCGAPPFWNRRQMIMIRQIMNGDYSFNNPEWDVVSSEAKDLIKNLLVVDPTERLTASEALGHPFFHTLKGVIRLRRGTLIHTISTTEHAVSIKEMRRRRFRVCIHCVRFMVALLRSLQEMPPHIDKETLCDDPYSIRTIRKAIDTAAFTTYKHWVKRESLQSRGALFENTLPYFGKRWSLAINH